MERFSLASSRAHAMDDVRLDNLCDNMSINVNEQPFHGERQQHQINLHNRNHTKHVHCASHTAKHPNWGNLTIEAKASMPSMAMLPPSGAAKEWL